MPRPEWAYKAYSKWHTIVCDHARPETCGYEGALWFQDGEAWGRKSNSGNEVRFYPNGDVVVSEPGK